MRKHTENKINKNNKKEVKRRSKEVRMKRRLKGRSKEVKVKRRFKDYEECERDRG